MTDHAPFFIEFRKAGKGDQPRILVNVDHIANIYEPQPGYAKDRGDVAIETVGPQGETVTWIEGPYDKVVERLGYFASTRRLP